jgi:type II secretory pathway component PulM
VSLAAKPIPSRDIAAWPKRNDAAAELGCSKSTVRRLEQRGVLEAERDAEGTTRIRPESLRRARAELAAMASHASADRTLAQSRASAPNPEAPTPSSLTNATSAASREAEIFAALSAGRSPIQVVIELGVSSADVAGALRAWEQLMAPWEPPASAVAAHVDALTSFARDLQAFAVSLDARVSRLEAVLLRGVPEGDAPT